MASSTAENVREATGSGGNNSESNGEEKKDDQMFECNICLDTARDAVVSMCGHLFCWPCLHQWLETRPNRQVCPVCKAAISKEKVVPLYGRGSTTHEDPREKVPPRPAGQRTEPEPGTSFPDIDFSRPFDSQVVNNSSFNVPLLREYTMERYLRMERNLDMERHPNSERNSNTESFGFGDNGFHMSFGIGAFPFGFFTSTLNFGEPRPSPAPRGTQQHMEEQFLSKIFLWLAIIFIAWLMMA